MPTLTDETVSTVSRLTRDLEEAVRQFHQARLGDDYACLLLDGVSLRVQRPLGPPPGADARGAWDAARWQPDLLPFLRRQRENQVEGLLQDLYRGGLEGRALGLILTDGCAGLAAAIRTVF